MRINSFILKEEKVLSIKLKCTGTGGTVELKWNRFIKLVLNCYS